MCKETGLYFSSQEHTISCAYKIIRNRTITFGTTGSPYMHLNYELSDWSER
jgi:hypothetical protein